MASIRVKTTKTTSGYRRKSDNDKTTKKTVNKSKTVKTIRKYER